jgi:hypothetical protein
MNKIIIGIAAACLMLCSCASSAIKEAEGVIERTFGSVPSNVEFKMLDKPDSLDTYALSVKDDVLLVE